ncbi:MAG: type II toxin-antitoxin system mRNA interferase toxin, RelE/StbE family [Elusimicrobia bacterium]|nr:type II toxin-antitoxin system mRNA interferase toxin, RelE/StbE family [Elusimicrobiota bacterium]
MASFKVAFLSSAEAEFRAVPFPFRRQINQRIMRLKDDPRPFDAERVSEAEKYRLKVHGWHILYRWDEPAGVAMVYAVRKG